MDPSPALVTQWFGTDIATAIRHREFISKIFYGTTPEAMRAALDCFAVCCFAVCVPELAPVLAVSHLVFFFRVRPLRHARRAPARLNSVTVAELNPKATRQDLVVWSSRRSSARDDTVLLGSSLSPLPPPARVPEEADLGMAGSNSMPSRRSPSLSAWPTRI